LLPQAIKCLLPGEITNKSGTSAALDNGNANTNTIVAARGNKVTAAGICNYLVLNGYDDWYLPSKDKLYKLLQNKVASNPIPWLRRISKSIIKRHFCNQPENNYLRHPTIIKTDYL
jgi:hypothetical protein